MTHDEPSQSPPDVLVATDAALARLAVRLLDESGKSTNRRLLVGIAGIPGSGKSTLAAKLHQVIDNLEPGVAVVVPMDGFHFSNGELDSLSMRQRKGAPDTFDAPAYIKLLREAGDRKGRVVFPIYDRGLHEPVLRDVPEQTLAAKTRIVITEGNYLLLDLPPWNALAGLLDESWFLEIPEMVARDRIIARHVRGRRTQQDAEAHFERSDAVNTRLVLTHCRKPDLRLHWP